MIKKKKFYLSRTRRNDTPLIPREYNSGGQSYRQKRQYKHEHAKMSDSSLSHRQNHYSINEYDTHRCHVRSHITIFSN